MNTGLNLYNNECFQKRLARIRFALSSIITLHGCIVQCTYRQLSNKLPVNKYYCLYYVIVLSSNIPYHFTMTQLIMWIA